MFIIFGIVFSGNIKAEFIKCDSCLFFYFNIANCINCNSLISPLVNNEYLNNHFNINFLLEEGYSGRGANILSEYLNRRVSEQDIYYSDSLISVIKDNTNTNTNIFFSFTNYQVIYNVNSLKETINFVNFQLPKLITKSKYLQDQVISNQLYLDIIDQDTFLIDLTLSKIFVNGNQIKHDLHVWDVPNLVKCHLKSIDSSNMIYKLEIDNIKKIDSTYLVFCSGNQFVQKDSTHIDVLPRSIILVFSQNELASLGKFKSYILEDENNCFYDDYAIFKCHSRYYIVSKCGFGELNPKLALIEFSNNEISIKKSNKINLEDNLKKSPGYCTDFGNNLIFFIGNNILYKIDDNGQLKEFINFNNELHGNEFLSGSTSQEMSPVRLLFDSGNTYRLKKLNVGNSLSDSYTLILSKKKCGNMVSNCLYDPISKKFIFINNFGDMVNISIL